MNLNDQQLDSFIKRYKEKLGIEITRVEAQGKALALIRYLAISVIPIDDEALSP